MVDRTRAVVVVRLVFLLGRIRALVDVNPILFTRLVFSNIPHRGYTRLAFPNVSV